MIFNNCLFEELKRDGEFTVLTAIATTLGMEKCRFVNCGGNIGFTGDEINFDQVIIDESSVSSLAVTAAQKLVIQYSMFSCQNNALAMTFTTTNVVINHTLFSVETPLQQALLTLTAENSADIHFCNCCFTCEPSLSFPYLKLTGSGNATFEDVCFDRDADQSIQSDGVIVNYDESVGFGSCQCWSAETSALDTSEPFVMTDTEEITTTQETPDESGENNVDVGMIVGIVIGILAVIAVVCVILIIVLRRRNASQTTVSQEQEQELPEETQPPSVSSMSVDEWAPSADNEMFRSDHTELFAETFEEHL